MTTNTNDTDRATMIVAAARAMHLTNDSLIYAIVDSALDAEPADYDHDAHRALHVLVAAMITSDDDFDDLRIDVRRVLDMLDDDDRRLLVELEHPFVARDSY